MSNFFTHEYNLDAYESEEDDGLERYLLHMDVDYFFAQVEIIRDKFDLDYNEGESCLVGEAHMQLGKGTEDKYHERFDPHD